MLAKKYTVHLISQKTPSYSAYYKTHTLWNDQRQLEAAIKLYAPQVDVFHCHNEPSWFVTMVKELCDVPVVLDVHDSFLARQSPEQEQAALDQGKKFIRVTTEERNNCQLADALVFPGQRFADLVRSEFGLTQPSIVLPSYVPRMWMKYDHKEWLGGLVYEGKVDLREDIANNPITAGFAYADYQAVAEQAKALGIDFHLYVVRTDQKFKSVYGDLAFVHPPKDIDVLLTQLSRHDWGLVGNLRQTLEWDVAMPNKLFEYIAAGVPVVSMYASESGEFIERHGLGIQVKSMEELRDRWREHEGIRKHLLKTRLAWCMERHIHTLEALYAGLCDPA